MSNWIKQQQHFSDDLQGRYCQILADRQARWGEQRMWEQRKRGMIAEILRQIEIEVRNDAAPVIQQLKKDIAAAFSK